MIAGAVVSGGLRSDSRAAVPSRPVGEKSIPVLPFQNRSADKENEFCTDGVHDNLLTSLTNIDQRQVVPSRSAGSTGAQKRERWRQTAVELDGGLAQR